MIVRAGAPRPTSIDELMGAALLARLDRLDLRSRKIFAGKLAGERRSKQRGRSVEFADFREYTPGDDIRFIDWNVYARLDRLFIRLFFEEQDLGLHVAIDASPSMEAGWGAPARESPTTPASQDDPAPAAPPRQSPSKLLFAQRLAMALGYVGLVNHNRVSMTIFRGPGRGVARLEETRGRRSVQRVARFLLDEAAPPAEGAPPTKAGEFTSAMRAVAGARRGKGVMVVISDFLFREGYADGLRYLAAGMGREAGAGDSFDTYCLQVLAPGEIDPSLERGSAGGGFTGDLRLTDIESGASAEVTISAALLKRYRAKLDEYVSGLATYCSARRMTHALLRSDEDVDRVVLETLRRRGMVG